MDARHIKAGILCLAASVIIAGLLTLRDLFLAKPPEMMACGHRRFDFRQSTIPGAGRGIFTKEAIGKGEYCCFFDGEDLTLAQYSMRIAQLSGRRAAESYALGDGGDGVRDGHREPKTSCGVAQLINDPIGLWFSHPTDLSTALEARADYTRRSMNISLLGASRSRPSPYQFWAQRDIEPGEELFWAYGSDYWLDAIVATSSNPMVVLIALLIRYGHTKTCTLRDGNSDVVDSSPAYVKDASGKIHWASYPMYDAGMETMLIDCREMTEDEAAAFLRDAMHAKPNARYWTHMEAEDDGSSVKRVQWLVRHVLSNRTTLPNLRQSRTKGKTVILQ